ncbi:MAG: DUF1330 domain-containing protein [Actinomycetota bacterium]
MFFDPSESNVKRLLARNIEGPVVMLNLVRFKSIADYREYPDIAPDLTVSGREAYDLYMAATLPLLEASGGSLDFVGAGGHCFVGPDDERWDLALLVKQASVESFFQFAENPDFLAGVGHRYAALEDSRILPLSQR